MSNEAKATLSVAAAFAAALLTAPTVQAEGLEASTQASKTDTEEIQPSPAAMERLEEAAQTAWFWWPFPPRFVELWPEVTHVESVRTA
ncbi:MAG TPA: hypothetical protein VNA21_14810 [Steroidobacteraceae bacterium]|nr:hypothetical protein [Steroidobacteraceae bacterium]